MAASWFLINYKWYNLRIHISIILNNDILLMQLNRTPGILERGL